MRNEADTRATLILRIVTQKDKLISEFLDYLFKFYRKKGIFIDIAQRAIGQSSINQTKMKALPIPLPPLFEQHRIEARIEALMECIREAKSLREEAQKDIKRLWKSVLAHTFPDPGTDLPEGWRWVRLGEVCKLTNGRAYRRIDWSNRGYPIIRIQNLNNPDKPFNYWSGSLQDQVVVRPGTVLISWSGTPGTSDILPKYSVLAINQQLEVFIKGVIGGVGLRHVTKGQVEGLYLPLPSLKEQQRIVSHLEEVRKRLQACNKAQDERNICFKKLECSILEKAFQGEL